MRITISPIKYLRFYFSPDVAANTPLIEKQNFRKEYGTDANGKWVGIRWTVNLLNQNDTSEVIGFLSEKRGYYVLENKEQDLKDLKSFVENYYINIEMYFEDNLPARLKGVRPLVPDYQQLSIDLYDFLVVHE